MTVASAVHRPAGPMLAKGGFELPLTNLAAAAALAATGPGRLRLGPRLPGRLTAAAAAVGALLGAASLAKLLTAQPPATQPPAEPADHSRPPTAQPAEAS